MATIASPASQPRYPVWLGLTSIGWAILGWVIATFAPHLAFVPGIEILHLVFPSVTVLLILGNFCFSVYAFYVRKVAIDRLLLVTGLQIGLFTTLFFQFAAHIGAECYWIQRPTHSAEWVQFSIAHALRATDVLDTNTIVAFGWNLQVIKHHSLFVGVFVVFYHVVIDLFMLGLFWAMLDAIKKRLMQDRKRAEAIRALGLGLFFLWLIVWLLCAWLRPWRLIDCPLWLGENILRVLDFPDAMDAFDFRRLLNALGVSWHEVPRELLENTLTFFCRFWIATGISLLLQWRIAHNKVQPFPAQKPPMVGRLLRLGVAAVLMAALIGTDTVVSAPSERITELTAVAAGDDEDRAELALAAIRRLGPNAHDAIGPLAESQSRLPMRRQKLIETLGYLGPSAIDPLRKIALEANRPFAELAIASLRRIGPRSAPTLAAVWGETKSGAVKDAADAGLRHLGLKTMPHLDAMPHLIEATDTTNAAVHLYWFNELDPNWKLRDTDNRTVKALKRWYVPDPLVNNGKDRSWIRDSGSAALPFLVKALKAENPLTCQDAAKELGKMGPSAEDAVPDLVKSLTDKDVRYAVGDALEKIGLCPKEALPDLIKFLAPGDSSLQRAAASVLRNISPNAKEAVPALLLARAYEDILVRDPADHAWAMLDPSAKQGGLIEALANNDPFIRSQAASALGYINPIAKEAGPALLKLLADEEWDVRFWAATALARIDPSNEAVAVLVEGLAHRDSFIRMGAARAMGHIGARAVPALVKARMDTNMQVRHEAFDALKRIGPSAIPDLVKALTDKDGEIRRQAAAALGSIGSSAKEAVPDLVKALADNDRNVRCAVADALNAIRADAKEAVPTLVKLLADEEWEVRFHAANALAWIDPSNKEAVQAVPVLVQGLWHTSVISRRRAAYALGNLGPGAKEALPALEITAKHIDAAYEGSFDYSDVQRAAKIAIERIHGK